MSDTIEITKGGVLILLALGFACGIFVGWDIAMSLVARREAFITRSLKMLLGKRIK